MYDRPTRIAMRQFRGQDQLRAKKPESRQGTLLMDKHRQMTVKVVHLKEPHRRQFGQLGLLGSDHCFPHRKPPTHMQHEHAEQIFF